MKQVQEQGFINSWLVPIPLAEQLKEIGFHEPCHFYHRTFLGWKLLKSKDIRYGNVTSDYQSPSVRDYNADKSKFGADDFSIPTWEQSFAFFRLKGCYISVEPYFDMGNEVWEGYEYFIEKWIDGKRNVECSWFHTYEEAREECLKKLISIEKGEFKPDVVIDREGVPSIETSYIIKCASDPDFMINQEGKGLVTDGYHTFDELYEFRKVYNALLFNTWAKSALYGVHKSWKHNDGEWCFGEEKKWFIVCAKLPMGIITNHYKAEDWELFQIPEAEKSYYPYDGHTPEDTLYRMKDLLNTSENEKTKE